MSQFLQANARLQARLIMTRWTVLIGATYLVLYGSAAELETWQQITVVAAFMSSLGLYSLAARSGNWERLRWPITLVDIGLVTAAVAFTHNTGNDFFLFFFLVLMIAGISSLFGITALATMAVCALYAGMMYLENGAGLWRDSALLIRVPFLFGVGLFFGSVSQEARREHARYHQLTDVTRKMVHRYHQVASERDRSRALLEIGQLALSSEPAEAVLRQIVQLVRRTVRVDRCSMVVFNEGERHAYLAACSDTDSGDVKLLLPLRHYPELQAALSSGEMIELRADQPSLLWEKVQRHLPEGGKFRHWLVIPIAQNDHVAGALFLRDSRADLEFHEDELVFCKAAAVTTASYLLGCDLVEEMRRRSRLDGLTGLLNFMSFRKELESELGIRAAGTDEAPLSLIMVDIDNLKVINDRYGHMSGNRVIEIVGKSLAKVVPGAKGVCRYGGDEFFALVALDKKSASERAERLLIMLENLPDDVPCKVEVSIGVSSYPQDGDVADALMDAADRSMYLAKGAGGNRIRAASSEQEAPGEVYEAVISVNARRLLPGDGGGLRQVLDEMLRGQEQELDSTAVQQSLRALTEAVDSKDPYTSQHSGAVSGLTGKLCEAMGLSARDTLAVEMGALVHDIGKIGIPDKILQKPGALTTRERMQIEQHPEIGAQILRPLPALKEVVPLVLHHHERWDGTGYPYGLKGDEIPIGAQIISLCDVWHALTSDRSYRDALPDDEARALIRNGQGTEWRSDLVDLFLEILDAALHDRDRNRHRRSA